MSWLKNWWYLILACVIGVAIGWCFGELLVMTIDKRIQQALGG